MLSLLTTGVKGRTSIDNSDIKSVVDVTIDIGIFLYLCFQVDRKAVSRCS